jgi:hypothetical protein
MSIDKKVADLEAALGRVALLNKALTDAILKKGLLTQLELAQAMTAADTADGERDGRLDLGSLGAKPK